MFQLALFVDFENKHMKNNEIDTGTNVLQSKHQQIMIYVSSNPQQLKMV
jgi:hypothetical protein